MARGASPWEAPAVQRIGGHVRRTGVVVGLLAAIAVVVVGGIALASFDKTQGGEVAVVRNGGPFDNNKVRQVIPPASPRKYVGLFSQVHKYPATQRFYTITADSSRGDRTGVDVVFVPTADGVETGIEGTIYFTLNAGEKTIEDFDDKYGTRTYRGADGGYRHAWEGDQGWETFLDQIVRPVIENDLREEVGNFECAELQASCILVKNGAAQAANPKNTAVSFIVNGGQKNNVNIAKIQNAINSSLEADLNRTLEGAFITNVRFNLSKITLPKTVQDAIDRTQAEFAAVGQAQAKVAQAAADAAANRQRQSGYSQCPACATIDTLKAIPPSVTTFAPGAGFAITPGSK